MTWDRDAACAGRWDLMDPPAHTPTTIRQAKTLCYGDILTGRPPCPVFTQCAQWAATLNGREDPGFIAAGATPEERSSARRSASQYRRHTHKETR